MNQNEKEVKCVICGNSTIINKKANASRALCDECKTKGLTPPNQTKTLICYNCHKEFEASIRGPKDIPCPDCKKLGFKSQSSVETGLRAKAANLEKNGGMYYSQTQEGRQKIKEGTIKACSKLPKTKKSNCIYCHKETEIPVSFNDDKAVCQECKDKGLTFHHKLKDTICYHCGIVFQIPSNVSDSNSTCPKCKSLGFKNKSSEYLSEKVERPCIHCGQITLSSRTAGESRVVCDSCKNKGLKSNDKTEIRICHICNKEFEMSIYGPKDVPCQHCRSLGHKSISASESGLRGNASMLKKYNGSHPMHNPEFRQKQINGLRRNFDNPDRKALILERSKETYKNKTGYDHHMKDPSVVAKIKETNIERYGVEYTLQSPIVRQKIKETNLIRYGTLCALQNPIVHEKSRQACLDKFNADHYMKSDVGKAHIARMIIDKSKIRVAQQLEYLDLELLDEYTNATDRLTFKCKKCGHEFITIWNYIQQGDKCPKCFPKHQPYSNSEKQVLSFIQSVYNGKIISNSRSILGNGKELDIYLPDKNIAIEYDGLFWHSDSMNTPYDYHLSKTEICESLGIQLIHIFEDEWIYQQDIVKERLKQIIGVSTSKTIYARECIIKEIDHKTKDEFLTKYHIQGKDISKIRLGAFYKDTLVSVMTFSHGNISKGSKSQDDVWELNRFCSNYDYRVVGIASKLLSHFKRNYIWSKIYSYADRRWSTGKLYERLLFGLIRKTNPNYWYIKGDKRIHRFNLRKTKDDPIDIPEYIIRLKQGYIRIFDCGSLKFEMINNEMPED